MKNGGPAFPMVGHVSNGEVIPPCDGMSLHQWYAGQALAGIRGGSKELVLPYAQVAENRGISICDAIAVDSYEQADAMLKAREETK